MNWQTIVTAMLPEHLLLAGIVAADRARDRAGPAARRIHGVAARRDRGGRRRGRGCAAHGLCGGAVSRSNSRWTRSPRSARRSCSRWRFPCCSFRATNSRSAQFPILLLSSLYGVCLLLSADSFLTLFLGLELMSLPVYVLVLLAFRRPESAEAALKYLVLGGTASATLLMGVSLLYGGSGSLALSVFAAALASSDTMASVGRRAGGRRVLPEGRDRAVPCLGAGRLRRRRGPGDRVHGDDHQGRRAARRGAPVRQRDRCRRRWPISSPSCRCCRSSGATSRRCGSRAFAA